MSGTDLACRECDSDDHFNCDNRSIYEAESAGEDELIQAIYGGPVTACCCDPRDAFKPVD